MTPASAKDTAAVLGKVREALQFYANDESGTDDCHVARECIALLDSLGVG